MLTDFLTTIEILESDAVYSARDKETGERTLVKAAAYRSQEVLGKRPETKTQADLDRVIALGKSAKVVDKFTAMVDLGIAWDWCMDYIYYLNEVYDWDNWEVEITYDDEGVEISRTEQGLPPVEPVRNTQAIETDYARTLFKTERAAKVENLTVEVDNMVFDGDEVSQARMARAALVMDDVETTVWVLTDNSVVDITKLQLINVLRLAGQKQTEIWTM